MAASSNIVDYIGSDVIANRPAAPATPTGGGAFYYATDTGVLYVWDKIAAAWDTVSSGSGGSLWWFDPPLTATLSTAITDGTVTGAAATDDSDAGLILEGTSTGADNSYKRLETAPTAPFSAITRVQMLARDNAHYNIGGLALRESSSGRKVIFGSMSGGRWGARRATGTSSGGDIIMSSASTLITDANCWFRVDCDASYNLTFYISQDGKHWVQVSSVTAATVGWAGVDQVGVGIYVRASSGLAMAATFEYYSAA